MKIFTILATVSLLALPALGSVAMNNDFVEGFEQGIQRGDGADISEFGCPQAHLAGPLGNVQQVLAPLKLMGGLVQDKNLETLLSTVDVFVNSISSLMAVFSNYEGDDFCAGLIFGQKGSHMLVQIAKTLINIRPAREQNSITRSAAKAPAPAAPKAGQKTTNKPNFRRWNGN